MEVRKMHMMRLEEAAAKKQLAKKRKQTPLAKEIESRREEMIRGIMRNTDNIINQQFEIASLPVESEGKNNDVVLKATNSLIDRVYGKPKESIDLTGNVQFSLKELAERRRTPEIREVVDFEELI